MLSTINCCGDITLKISGYTRISVDLNEDSQENTSIENQKAVIERYVADNFPDAEMTLFVDRDRSGYTFAQREEYQKMRTELMSGAVRILIVKDFSRFSRRNSLGLLELETLRDAGVRIISIGDNIDYPTKDDWMLIQFKFLMNEFPVTDTSKKIKQIINNRQKDGKWVCAVPYGYRITNTKEMTYEIDPPAAEVVREVFRLYTDGWGYKRIANHLTDTGVPTPRANEIACKESEGRTTKLQSRSAWSIVTVQKMLSNDFYIGTLRQRKYKRNGINGADLRTADEEHIVIENAHEPIVDSSVFAYAQELLKQRSTSNYRGEKKYATDYSGFLFCGDCGSPLFSRSLPRLAPQYVCGAYLKRGLKACTSHQVRVDKLDELLKRYIQRVADNSQTMMETLEAAIRQQPQREEDVGRAIDALQRQLEDARLQLKTLLKRKVMDTMGKSPEQAQIIGETYDELEKELTERIANLETQVNSNIDLRNEFIQANRKAKTVIDVFRSILEKPHLSKRDIGLIIDRITVYPDYLDVKLKADINELLQLGEAQEEKPLVQSTGQWPDKIFRINVINEGDPLEIYTTKEGEVIFKKYSQIRGLEDFAAQFCDSLSRNTDFTAAVADRDTIIAVAGSGRRDLLGKAITSALEEIMEKRSLYVAEESPISACEGIDSFTVAVAAPILCEGDVLGLVLFLTDRNTAAGEAECKLAQTVATFLGKHMES
mgnify:CR=1 FL=1